MADGLTTDEIRALLKLEPNATCGFVRVSYLSTQLVAPGGLPAPFADGRPMGSALCFMVTPTAPVQLHRIRNDQLYHYYLGDPLEVLMLCAGRHDRARRRRAGLAQRGARAAPDSRQHLPYRAPAGAAALVSRRQHRVAGGGAGRCRAWRSRCAGGEIRRCGRPRRADLRAYCSYCSGASESCTACSTIHPR